jgi:hypothetical protein
MLQNGHMCAPNTASLMHLHSGNRIWPLSLARERISTSRATSQREVKATLVSVPCKVGKERCRTRSPSRLYVAVLEIDMALQWLTNGRGSTGMNVNIALCDGSMQIDLTTPQHPQDTDASCFSTKILSTAFLPDTAVVAHSLAALDTASCSAVLHALLASDMARC